MVVLGEWGMKKHQNIEGSGVLETHRQFTPRFGEQFPTESAVSKNTPPSADRAKPEKRAGAMSHRAARREQTYWILEASAITTDRNT